MLVPPEVATRRGYQTWRGESTHAGEILGRCPLDLVGDDEAEGTGLGDDACHSRRAPRTHSPCVGVPERVVCPPTDDTTASGVPCAELVTGTGTGIGEVRDLAGIGSDHVEHSELAARHLAHLAASAARRARRYEAQAAR